VGEVPVLTWESCYDSGWGDLLHPSAYQHPAKLAYGLTVRLYDHGFERGWWQKGSTVIDPFAGVCCGGIVAAYRGLRFIGVELEPRFVALSEANLALHRARWRAAGDPEPAALQGDSRRLAELLGGGCEAVVTSPPYADTPVADLPRGKAGGASGGIGTQYRLGNRGTNARKKADGTLTESYGTAPGQLGNLPAGDADAVLTSPPYAECLRVHGDGIDWEKTCAAHRGSRSAGRGAVADGYGHAEGQLGAAPAETYWSEVAKVWQQTWLLLRPGGVLCAVLKDHVKRGARVPLCDQTLRLLLSLGFEPVERIRCLLVRETAEASLFGGECVRQKSRKSFFRRIHERRYPPGDPRRIDWEEIVVVRKGDRHAV
jgi:hypothetical protein